MLTEVKKADFKQGPLNRVAVELLDLVLLEKLPIEIIKG